MTALDDHDARTRPDVGSSPATSILLLDDGSAGEFGVDLTIDSLLAQVGAEFEVLWLCSSTTATRRTLDRASRSARRSGRRQSFRAVQGAAEPSLFDLFHLGLTNVRGKNVCLLHASDALLPGAMASLQVASDEVDDLRLVYADERSGGVAMLKPDWSPERLRHHNYIGRPWLARRDSLLDVLPHVTPGRAWQHDLLLALGERDGAVLHIPSVLCATPTAPLTVADDVAAVACVQRHLSRTNVAATAVKGEVSGLVQLQRQVDRATRVSLIIPTGWAPAKTLDVAPSVERELAGPVVDGLRSPHAGEPLVVGAVRTLLEHTEHAVEVVVVYDEPVPDGALESLVEVAGERLRLVRYAKPFNFSEKCNVGALATDCDVLVMVNDDVLPITQGWLEQLIAPLSEPDVGVTGAKLRFPDRSIQSGGHLYRHSPHRPAPEEAFRLWPADDPGPSNLLVMNREVSGVTGACLAVRSDVYKSVGGMTETLSHNYNDVDFSLKIRRAGFRIVWVSGCEMVHLESQTRQRHVDAWESEALTRRWGGFNGDAYLP